MNPTSIQRNLVFAGREAQSSVVENIVRISERIAAAIALAACTPVLAAAGATIAVLSRRTPIVAHRRVGLNGRQFWVIKLRTMWPVKTGEGGSGWLIERLGSTLVPLDKRESDNRITSRFAAFLRKYSIDELPQLLHVAAGTMSFVGPRPLTRQELDEYYGDAAGEVLSVLPGITGLWQILGRNRLTYRQRLRLDLTYVRNGSWGLDLAILKKTPVRVLTGRDAY